MRKPCLPTPAPAPVVVIVTPTPPLFSFRFEPAAPVVNEFVKAPAISSAMDPTVKPAAPASLVTVRFAVGLLKIAVAPRALGTVAGVQFAAVAQLPPPPGTHVCTRMEGATSS